MIEMSEPSTKSASSASTAHFKGVFSVNRIEIDVDLSSMKRLLEHLSSLFSRDNELDLDQDTVFHTLLERERLGSTDLGNGVMIPHGRLYGLKSPIGAIVRVKDPIKLNGETARRIWIACGLLVPAEAADIHVKLLGHLASAFETGDLYRQLMSATTKSQLHSNLIAHDNPPGNVE